MKAPIAPGVIAEAMVISYSVLNLGEKESIHAFLAILALDGERELEINGADGFELKLDYDGPRFIDVSQTIRRASQSGFFRKT